jgi:hypothetical protein
VVNANGDVCFVIDPCYGTQETAVLMSILKKLDLAYVPACLVLTYDGRYKQGPGVNRHMIPASSLPPVLPPSSDPARLPITSVAPLVLVLVPTSASAPEARGVNSAGQFIAACFSSIDQVRLPPLLRFLGHMG